MIYTKLILSTFLFLTVDAIALIGMIISDAIWLAAIPAIVSVLTLATTIVLAFLTRKNTAEISAAKKGVDEAKIALSETKAIVDETKEDVKKTHGLVNSQSERERDQAKQLGLVLAELAELRGKTEGIQAGLAAGRVTADEKTDAFEKGLGMVQTQSGPRESASEPTATTRNLEKVSDHLKVVADQMEATGKNTETVRDNTKANEDNTAALDANKPKP